jgi:L-ribulose-5-phosphate 3-epimerase
MQLGVIISLSNKIEDDIKYIHNLGFPTYQLNCWDPSLFTKDFADKIEFANVKHGVKVTALWCGWEGPAIWNFRDGPLTLGLVPSVYRQARVATLWQGALFAQNINVRDLITHVGFIPEDPNDPNYRSLLVDLRYLIQKMAQLEINFLFETGQETPVTLMRTIEDIGLNNVGVNIDPANLIMYGKGNPVDAIDVLAHHIKGVHAKDGLYPTSGYQLGFEVPLGEGKVSVTRFIERLKEIGYDGPVTIEREIKGEQQEKDILRAKSFLETLV